MSKKQNVDFIGGSGVYTGYETVIETADKVKAKVRELKGSMPKGISFKVQSNKYLYLQWDSPVTGGRTTKKANVPFNEMGVYQARDKAWKIKNVLI